MHFLLKNQRLTKGTVRWGILAGLVVVELLLVAFLQFTVPVASHAFLIKNGKDYVVFWSEDGTYDSRHYSELRKAIDFAKMELGLEQAPSTNGMDIERLWIQDRFGAFVVMWKTFRFPYLNQLTFNRESDAKFFEAAFRSGAYSPSPFGHSVLLLPTAAR
jgi:hypothetical protein